MKKHFSYRFYFLLITTLILAGCDYKNEPINTETIVTNAEKEVLFKMILDHPDLQQYLHPNSAGRVPLKIKSNDELGTNLSIHKFGEQVEFVDFVGSSKNIPVFEIISFKINNNRVMFEALYDIEGVTIKGILTKNANRWSFKEVEVFER